MNENANREKEFEAGVIPNGWLRELEKLYPFSTFKKILTVPRASSPPHFVFFQMGRGQGRGKLPRLLHHMPRQVACRGRQRGARLCRRAGGVFPP